MKLSGDEIDAMLRLIDYYVPDLHAEIGRSDSADLRRRLRAQEALLLGLRGRLLDARRDAASDELLGL